MNFYNLIWIEKVMQIAFHFLSVGNRKKATVGEMLEIVPKDAKGNECLDRMAGSYRYGIDEEISGRRNA